MPASTLPKVDLPAPFSPISPWHSPRATSRLTSLSATTPPKVLVISLNWMKVSDIGVKNRGPLSPPSYPSLSLLEYDPLFFEPLLPVLRIGIHVLLGHHGERIDHFDIGRGLVLDDLVEQDLDRLGPPAIAVLGEKRFHLAILDVAKLRGERIDGHHLDRARRPLQGIGRKERPASNHRPALNARIGILRLLDGLRRLLRSLHMVEDPRIVQLHVGILFQRFLGSSHPILQVGRALVARQNRNGPLLAHRLGQHVDGALSARLVIGPIVGKALAVGRIGVKTHHCTPPAHRLVNRGGHRVSLRAGNRNPLGPHPRQRLNRLRLLGGVLIVGVRISNCTSALYLGPSSLAASAAPTWAA